MEAQTDANLAQSQAVAGQVVKKLGLQQSVASFQAAYTVTIVTDTVLAINVGAPSSADAVQRASAAGHCLSPVPCGVHAGTAAATGDRA